MGQTEMKELCQKMFDTLMKGNELINQELPYHILARHLGEAGKELLLIVSLDASKN